MQNRSISTTIISVDLTIDCESINYGFAVVNFSHGMNFQNGVFKYFDSENDLHCLINHQSAEDVYLRFPSILCFLLFLGHFLLVLEAGSKLVKFYTKFWVKRARFLASTCTSLLLHSKPVQQNYRHFLKVFKPKSPF